MESTTSTLDLEALEGELAEKGRELLDKAVEFAREQPHVAIAAAFGIGWILGNGLSPRIVTAGAKIGIRSVLGGAMAGTGLLGVLGGTNDAPPSERSVKRQRRAGGDSVASDQTRKAKEERQ